MSYKALNKSNKRIKKTQNYTKLRQVDHSNSIPKQFIIYHENMASFLSKTSIHMVCTLAKLRDPGFRAKLKHHNELTHCRWRKVEVTDGLNRKPWYEWLSCCVYASLALRSHLDLQAPSRPPAPQWRCLLPVGVPPGCWPAVAVQCWLPCLWQGPGRGHRSPCVLHLLEASGNELAGPWNRFSCWRRRHSVSWGVCEEGASSKCTPQGPSLQVLWRSLCALGLFEVRRTWLESVSLSCFSVRGRSTKVAA